MALGGPSRNWLGFFIAIRPLHLCPVGINHPLKLANFSLKT